MKLQKPINPNYAATIITLANEDLFTLPNCDNVQAANLFGNSVIVSKQAKAGDKGLFFPVECQLSKEFLRSNNLYRKAEWGNIDPLKTGYFDLHGRIRCVKFRGHKSEGFWIPIEAMTFALSMTTRLADFNDGDTFDTFNGFEICRKFIPTITNSGGPNASKSKTSALKARIVEGQFKFHFDTANLRRNIDKINPTDVISISDKWHGTSAIVSKLLVKRKLSFVERMAQKFGAKIQDTNYGCTYSSRKVIKNVSESSSNNYDFFGNDTCIWGTVAKEISSRIPLGYTVYGEIVGYHPTGKAIQAAPGGKPYHYGCEPGEHKFMIYRVTSTNIEGKTIDLSRPQMKEFCLSKGLETVKEIWYGSAVLYCPWEKDCTSIDEWRKSFLKKLESEFVNDQMCPWNNGTVPAEGIVVTIDHLEECESFKLKNFKFLECESKLLDSGAVDIETQESEE